MNRHQFHVFLFFSMTCVYDLFCGVVVVVVVHAAAVVHVAAAADASVSDVAADLVDVAVAAWMMFVSNPLRCVVANLMIPNFHFSLSIMILVVLIWI